MTYATRADLSARFGAEEIADLAGAAPGEGEPDTRLDAAIADASAEIDGVLAIAYDLPLYEGTYPLLVQIACTLARHRLYDDAEPEGVRDAATRARAKLRGIAEGKYRLVTTSGVLVARRTSAKAVGPEPALTRKALEDF